MTATPGQCDSNTRSVAPSLPFPSLPFPSFGPVSWLPTFQKPQHQHQVSVPATSGQWPLPFLSFGPVSCLLSRNPSINIRSVAPSLPVFWPSLLAAYFPETPASTSGQCDSQQHQVSDPFPSRLLAQSPSCLLSRNPSINIRSVMSE